MTKSILTTNAKTASVDALGTILADTIDLALATKQAHWNISGPRFLFLHEMLDGFRRDLDVHVDAVAERIVQLGEPARGTTQAVALSTRLDAYPIELRGEHNHLRELAERYGLVARKVREAVDQTGAAGDANTSDILTGYSKMLDKCLWFMEAHLQGS
ncbi:DNA starvation/stationary phase protection protein Dps [Rhizobium lentis]|uniref:DNA starvation/stationary phase protection protein Dps n=1 Tax=Rhizobium lentis TaxID=1138194 RepID=A0ABS7IFT1_9HYPH|nr:DNA starvation/stationary phase protection protein Dps [Rhizobium lentis]MBX5088319.1 DNA starvation/stationary phase protection protein Dps [Rhizobium lentis]